MDVEAAQADIEKLEEVLREEGKEESKIGEQLVMKKLNDLSELQINGPAEEAVLMSKRSG